MTLEPGQYGQPLPERVGHYRILEKLGEGGMGVVYVAEDERLGRRVAVKLLRGDAADPNGRQRLIREARVAAAIPHPLICQVYELGEWGDQPFIVMELIAGEPLTRRLASGPLPPPEALRIITSVAEALCVLHRHGVVHRDLKPSNIFLTSAGIKVLDFGLARPEARTEGTDTTFAVTGIGTFVGTPQYAAPEQLTGGVVDARADLFAAGAILFEMLVGRPPFTGATLATLVHAVVYETPPALTGSSSVSAINRLLQRLLAKQSVDRYPSADALAADLRSLQPLVTDDRVKEARPILRLAVLPFRLLKPDTEIDYLTGSLADALGSALSGLETLVVRSTLKSARYAGAVPDFDRLAADLAVDVVLTGSILRAGDRLRVNVELVGVPAGEVLWTQSSSVALDAVLELHDQLAARVMTSLPLGERDRQRPSARAADAKAFDLYLRGMQLRMETSSWPQARAYFDQAVGVDPAFAPAWAELGRLDRLRGKYGERAELSRAEPALVRALALDPDNGAAHHYYAQLEIDLGRAGDALGRLLQRVRERRAEPQVYAALVHACRYAGLLEESIAADEQARHLDPTTTTSVLHTYYMKGDYHRALAEGHRSSDPFEARVLFALGREAEAIAAARREEARFASVPLLSSFAAALRAALEDRTDEALAALRLFDESGFSDGEGLFYVAEIYARLRRPEAALAMLERAIDAGFLCVPAFERDPALAPLRSQDAWQPLIDRGRRQQEIAAEAFVRAGGSALLGVWRGRSPGERPSG